MHWLNCISPIEPKAQEVVPLKITTSYLSFYCCWFIEPFFECIKEFSRIVCVSLFSYQGSLFSVSQTAHLLYHIFFCLSRTFFKFFQTFSMFFQAIRSLVDSLFTLPHSERIVNKFFDFFQSFSSCFFKRIISLWQPD